MQDFDHKTLIASLSPEQRNALIEKSDAHGLWHFALHAGAIGLCATLIMMDVTLWPIIMIVQGILINFLFTALHETTHNTPFKTDVFNIWVGRICGFFVLLGPQWFRYFHLAHHRYTHDPDKDPELASPKPSTTWQYVRFLSGIPEWIDRIKLLVRHATQINKDSYVPRRGRPKVMQEARVQLALYAAVAFLSIAFWSPLVLFVWLLPIVIGGPFLRGYLLAEHARCPHVASMLENTRTTITNKLVRLLAWNMPYHAEHHAYPSVPFHKLPAFHEHTREHIKHQAKGYLRFNQTYLRDTWMGDMEHDATLTDGH